MTSNLSNSLASVVIGQTDVALLSTAATQTGLTNSNTALAFAQQTLDIALASINQQNISFSGMATVINNLKINLTASQ